MKFYEFNDFGYYALILAGNEIEAKEGYGEVVADLDEDEKDLTPDIIAEKEALEKYKKGCIEGCQTDEEKEKDFYKAINNFKKFAKKSTEKYLILLIDGGLI
ncbi:hypothetical protein FDE98_14860 [Clostridium sporogenes]|uniref:Uncharacterized protein n=1 Tax=Clostridium sporogenes TaxID=1509 RepID=A0A7X5SZ99_CLOSG|nr:MULTISPECIES: hypothetical protein [Clostridium]AJD29373.1 hypothetical protein T258_3892 [Clostridium botulinum Prevot_594]NFL97871.1 hypothetical protein [Clostridium botulinum]KEI84046.1 hypothetical protein N493_19285 [Clostridium botulinum B2 433]NFP55395.1 hypothetical protein [Clostridium botulinum]NFQ18064.1 hypothetical protein [Clostridium sporogenes]